MINRLLGGRTASGSTLVAAGILLSRVAGLAREIALGIALGVSPATDAFRFAMRVPNVLQNLLGEGALSASFIPVYARLVENGEEGEADELAGTIATLLAAATAVLVALGVVLAGPLVWLLTSWEDSPEQFDLAVTLTRITTVGLGFLVLSAWCLGILNSHRSFFLPYAAPIVWNGAQILVLGVAVVAGWSAERGAVAVAVAVVVGGLLQLAIQLPRVRRLAPHLRASFRRNAEVDDVLHRFGPAVGSRGVVQISSFVDTFLAGALVLGALSTYTFAATLYLLPISLFGVSVAVAELAEMSRRSDHVDAVLARVGPALRRVLVPAGFMTAIYLAASRPLVDGLFGFTSRLLGRGFGSDDVTAVALVLAAFALGLPAAMTARIAQNTLYSLGEVRGPARIAVVRLAVAAAASLVLMFQLDWLFIAPGGGIESIRALPNWPLWESVPAARRLAEGGPPHLGAVGLALGSSMAAWVEWVLLRRLLARRLGQRVRSGWIRPVIIAGAAAAGVMLGLGQLPIPSPIDAAVILVTGAAIYVGSLWMQGVRVLPPASISP